MVGRNKQRVPLYQVIPGPESLMIFGGNVIGEGQSEEVPSPLESKDSQIRPPSEQLSDDTKPARRVGKSSHLTPITICRPPPKSESENIVSQHGAERESEHWHLPNQTKDGCYSKSAWSGIQPFSTTPSPHWNHPFSVINLPLHIIFALRLAPVKTSSHTSQNFGNLLSFQDNEV